jgi:hypothetical protein
MHFTRKALTAAYDQFFVNQRHTSGRCPGFHRDQWEQPEQVEQLPLAQQSFLPPPEKDPKRHLPS